MRRRCFQVLLFALLAMAVTHTSLDSYANAQTSPPNKYLTNKWLNELAVPASPDPSRWPESWELIQCKIVDARNVNDNTGSLDPSAATQLKVGQSISYRKTPKILVLDTVPWDGFKMISDGSSVSSLEVIRVHPGIAKTVVYFFRVSPFTSPPFRGFPFSFFDNYGDIYSGLCSVT